MHEMNGNWYPWGGPNNNSSTSSTDGPSKYIQAWRHIHDIFQSVGASNVVWVWSPNWESVPKDAYNAYSNYYPGDNYVDWVGIDGYNWGTTQTWSSWMNYSTIESAIYGSYSATKPIMTAETASCEQGGNKAQWIADTQAAAKSQFPDIRAFIWFNESKECDWRVNSSSTALGAYQTMGADPYFNP
jgi:beta-mannanase